MSEIAPLRPGDPPQLGDYRLLGRLGEGGQGVVYLGENAGGEQAAVKLLHVRLGDDSAARARFGREFRAAGRVASFCTAGVLTADLEGDVPYIASEYIDGPSLRALVESGGPLAGNALDRLAIGTATALTAIHQAGIVHRDFKPDNVLLAADGPRVVDFGIARLLDATGTVTTQAIGTPAYMSPEQVTGDPIGPATDVFAWGATLVYAATAEAPFAGESLATVLNKVLNHHPDLDGLPDPLRGVVADCLRKDAADRPTADQVLLRLLGRANGAASTAVLTEGVEAATPKPRRRTRRPLLAGLAVALVVTTTAAALLLVRSDLVVPKKNSPAPAGYGSILEKARATQHITIGVRGDIPNVGFQEEGFDIDVARYIAGRLGVPATGTGLTVVGAGERESTIESGEVDLLIGTFSINDERKRRVSFAGPYYLAHRDVIVRAADTEIVKVSDLERKKVCVPSGSSAWSAVSNRGVKLVTVAGKEHAECATMLADGRADAIVGDDLILAGFAARLSDRYRLLGAGLSDERYGVALPHGDSATCRAVNDAIAAMYKDGTVKKLLAKHFSRVDFTPELKRPRPEDCG